MRFLLVLSLIAGGALAAAAQQQPAQKAATEIIASSEKIVCGAPFSAEAISESLQILADGNRIARSSINKLYRDSEGRFRREGIAAPGPAFGAYVQMEPTVLILDPINGFKYYLNIDSKTVRRFTLRMPAAAATGLVGLYSAGQNTALAKAELSEAGKRARDEIRTRHSQVYAQTVTAQKPEADHAIAAAKVLTGQVAVAGAPLGKLDTPGFYGLAFKADTKTELLGMQTIEGIPAEGTRTVTTIPVGAIGNERPIDIVYERWYSKDLQMIISSRHSDPRFGDQTYKLVNIVRADPDLSLFTLPAGFKLVPEQPMPRIRTTVTVKAPMAPVGFPPMPKPASKTPAPPSTTTKPGAPQSAPAPVAVPKPVI